MYKLFLIFFSISGIFTVAADAQNVGIGTNSPEYKLTIQDSLGGGIGFAHVSPDGQTALGTYVSDGYAYIQTHTNTDLKFATNNAEYQMVIQTGTGNVGIGSIEPTQKLEVAGNAKINGNLQVMDGSQGKGKVFTSDAVGNGTWEPSAYGNKERFQFRMQSVESMGHPEGVLKTIYNLGTASAAVQGVYLYDDKYMTVFTPKAGLYHFDWVVYSVAMGVYTSALIPFVIYRNSDEVYRYYGTYKDDPVSNYISFEVSHQASFDMYMPASSSLQFSVPFVTSSTADNYQMTVTGHLIAE